MVTTYNLLGRSNLFSIDVYSYGIQVQLFSSDFKREVGRLIDEEGIKAIIMGNRRSDPWS